MYSFHKIPMLRLTQLELKFQIPIDFNPTLQGALALFEITRRIGVFAADCYPMDISDTTFSRLHN
jgi:hypothetical protein